MSNISSRRHWRRGSLGACLAVFCLTAAACGGGGGSSSSSSSSSGAGSSSSSSSSGGSSSSSGGASKAACGTKSLDPYKGIKAAKAPSVTAGQGGHKPTLPKGKPGKGKPKITLGSKNFAESTTVATLYKQALEAKGYKVGFKNQVGGSETIDKAFKANKIDAYPEYLGEITTSLAENKQPDTAKKNYQLAKKFEQNKRDGTIFRQTPYQDVDILLVKPAFCKKHNLTSAASLKNVGTDGSKVIYTAQSPARTRYAGFKGLKQAYGLTKAKFKGTETGGQTLKVVDKGDANVADGFSTTQSIVDAVDAGKFVALKDPKHIMGFQYVAPVVKQSVAKKEGSAFKQTLNWVDAKLTLKVIHSLNKAVQDNHVAQHKAASKFLKSNGLK
jgi:osmoprotectant transport system substrate-binding protein